MEIVNGARHTVADVAVALDKTGREHLVVVVKATYRIPANGKTPRPIVPPQPLATSDIFAGEAGLSAPLYEADFVRHKSKCDVLFNASAHTPGERLIEELGVAVRVGDMRKTLRVTGDRQWGKSLLTSASRPRPFATMPLHYGRAFGGTRQYRHGEQILTEAFHLNLIGTGYNKRASLADGLALPNLEALDTPVTRPDGEYAPVALSAVARNWLPRRRLAGTYDEHWQKEIFPFLPADFDERYFQCAPPDQQIDYPRGGEQVVLINLMKKREEVHFKLPKLTNLPIKILAADYQVHTPPIVADTLYFEPDEERFSVVWRTSVPIKRRMQEYKTIAIGHVCKNWWEAKIVGATHCTGCADQRRNTESAPQDCPEDAQTGNGETPDEGTPQ